MLWGPPFVAPIPVAAPNPLSLPDAAHLRAAGRHSFPPGGQRAGPLESRGRASAHKSRVHRLLCFRTSSEADIIPRVDQVLLWSSDPVQNSSLLGGMLPLRPVWDSCSSFPAPHFRKSPLWVPGHPSQGLRSLTVSFLWMRPYFSDAKT